MSRYETLPALAACVPQRLRARLLSQPQPPAASEQERFAGAVLLADLCGFTRLTERLARRGPGGAEAVQEILNRCFGALTQAIGEHGGEVVKFAGDAALALWTSDNESLSRTVTRAAAAALDVQARLDGFEAEPGEPLRIRVAVSAGPLWSATLGGVQGRWEWLLSGEAFLSLRQACELAEPGHVVMAGDAHSLLSTEPGLELEGEVVGESCLLLTALRGAPSPRMLPSLEPTPEAEQALRAFVPRTVLDGLDAGQTEWLAELRHLSILFAELSSRERVDETPLAHMQRGMLAAQDIVYRLGGSINQLMTDDKGTVLIAAWGLARHSYEDGAERAASAALSLCRAWGEQGLEIRVGLAAGRAFAGWRGAPERRELGLIGDVMNRAARLMQRAAPGQALADKALESGARRRVRSERQPDMIMAGRAQSLEVYGLRREIPRQERKHRPLVGRREELELLLADLVALKRDSGVAVRMLEGEPGIGKSRLVLSLLEAARRQHVPVVLGSGDALEGAPYHLWREPLRTALGLRDRSAEQQRDLLRRACAESPHGGRWSLLGAVLGVEVEESSAVRAMGAQGRADATRELLYHLVANLAGGDAGRLFLVLEDAHWMGSASWGLVETLARRLPSALILLVLRPEAEAPLPDEARPVLTHPSFRRLRLHRLGPEQAAELAARELGVETLPRPVLRLLKARAEGHPFFTLELVRSLREQGLIQVRDGQCEVAAPGLAAGAFPDTVEGVVAGRIDRLGPEPQLTLKVASVYGRSFLLGELRRVHPIVAHHGDLDRHLDEVSRLELVRDEGEDRYHFLHAIVRDVAYAMLPMTQRRTLHRAVAEDLEREAANDPTAAPLLAEHWQRAAVPERAASYLERAGAQALATGVFREASQNFTRLLELAEEGEIEVTAEQRGHYQRCLGQALYALGQLPQSRPYLEAAVGAFDRALPGQRFLALALVGESLGLRRKGRRESSQRQEAAAALRTLGRVHHLAQQPGPAVYTILRRFRLLEHAEPSAEKMSAYAGMIYLTALLGREGKAETYLNRLLLDAQAVDEPLALAESLYPVSITRLGRGQWRQGRREAEQAREIFQRLGERQGYLAQSAVLAHLEEMVGRLDASKAEYRELRRLATAADDELSESWAWGGLAMISLRRGLADDAVQQAKRALALTAEAEERVSQLSNLGTLTVALWRLGRLEEAANNLRRGLDLMATFPAYPTAHHALNGFDKLTEACILHWRHEPANDAWLHACQRASAALGRLARLFPIARPAARTWKGKLLQLDGRGRSARRVWLRGLREAERLDMPYETARLHRELAQGPSSKNQRQRHFQAAEELFRSLGAESELGSPGRLD